MPAPAAASSATGESNATKNQWTFWRLLIVVSPIFPIYALYTFTKFVPSALMSSDALMPTIFILIGMVFAIWLIIQARPWLYLTAGIAVALMPIIGMFLFAFFVLTDPLTGDAFVSALMFVLAICFALPAGIRGFKQTRKGHYLTIRQGWKTGHGLFVVAVAFLVVGAIYAGTMAVASAAGSSSGGAVDFDITAFGGKTANLTTQDIAWHPADLPISVNTPTKITIQNKDGETHTFTYKDEAGTEHSHTLLAGSTNDVYVLFKNAGTVKFRCEPHSSDYDNGMVGKMTVA